MGDVIMTITVDWEGEKLVPGDLQAMKILNQQLNLIADKIGQAIPLTHFICAAYFTRTDVEGEREKLAKQIRDSGAIKSVDEIGVHVHCWRGLALESGIKDTDIKGVPIGVDPNSQPPVFRKGLHIGPDIGYTVPVGIYSKEQLTSFLQTTINLLKKYLPTSDPPVSYRSGMWVTCDVVFDALRQTQLRNEASAFPFNYMNGPVKSLFDSFRVGAKMIPWNVTIWGNSQYGGTDQFLMNSQSFAQYNTGILGMGDAQISGPKIINGIVEVPDTGALIPVTNLNLMNAYIDRAFEIAKTSSSDVYVSIGFHQEDCGQPAFFDVKNFPLTKPEIIRVNAILGAVAHAISKAQGVEFPVKFLTKEGFAQHLLTSKKPLLTPGSLERVEG